MARVSFGPPNRIRRLCAHIDVTPTEVQLRAMEALDRLGYRVFADFGYGNAVEKLREHRRAARQKAARRRKRQLRRKK